MEPTSNEEENSENINESLNNGDPKDAEEESVDEVVVPKVSFAEKIEKWQSCDELRKTLTTTSSCVHYFYNNDKLYRDKYRFEQRTRKEKDEESGKTNTYTEFRAIDTTKDVDVDVSDAGQSESPNKGEIADAEQ